jgi:23S rRNA pseudouridine1911/1915/1917 synthase
MKSIGHPLLGDPVYGPANSHLPMVKHLKSLPGDLLNGQVLHAGVLGFVHPITGQYLEFREELPEYFTRILEEMRTYYHRSEE